MQDTLADARALRDAIAQREPEMLADLERLVRIDSGSYDAAGVDAVGDALELLWQRLGFRCARRALAGFGSQRIFSRRFDGRGRVLILGHLDTVWPAGTVEAWPFRVEDGFAHGPGVGDMKGGLVMAHAAIRALIEFGFDGVAEIRHILVPDEELGSAASRGWIEEESRHADWILVLEPARADGAVVVSRGVVGALVVRAEGQSAHTTVKTSGVSALRELAGKIAALEDLADESAGEAVNVGILRGGDARQVVPSRCEMHIDLRAQSQASGDALLARVLGLLQQAADPRVRIDVSGGITRPAFPPKASGALYDCAAEVAGRLGIDYPAVHSGGGSDGSFGAALGRPALDGLGPVCLDACSRRERIAIASLAQRAAVMAGLITALPQLGGRTEPTWD